MDKVQEGK